MANLSDVYRIDNYCDNFALGHYARVLDAVDLRGGATVAFKVLRPEHLAPGGEPRWEYRAFGSEADLLSKLADNPHVVRLHDCGYIESESEAPGGGEIESFGTDMRAFNDALDRFSERGWRPYLALENLPRYHNLFYLMRPDRSGQRYRLPTEEALALALQFGELLKVAHTQRIVYMDHKLEHVYWDGRQIKIIDWNSSRLLPATEAAQQARVDIHNLCVGILYPAVTGLSPQKTTLRPQPGSLSDVEARYAGINELDFGIEPTLSESLRAALQRGAAQQFETAEAFIRALQEVASQNGWDFPGHYTSPASRDARANLRKGLQLLRDGQSQLRAARELFREAAIEDGISEEMEDELRRLVKAVNEMYQYRVIP